MKLFTLATLALALNFSVLARAEIAPTAESGITEESSPVDLVYNPANKNLKITYHYMRSNSCSDKVKNLKTKNGVISFDLVNNPAERFCLMVISASDVTVTVKNFKADAKLVINGNELGTILLNGDSVSFQSLDEVVEQPAEENENVELNYDVLSKNLEVKFHYMQTTSCADNVTNLTITSDLISFDLTGEAGRICLMVLRPGTAIVNVPNFSGEASLVIDGIRLGEVRLSADGQTAVLTK